MSECPKDLVCFTEDEWIDFINEYELEILDDIGSMPVSQTSDAAEIANFTWQVLFLSPWELAYIALPMGVLAFYGLSIYAVFKYIQKKFTP